LRATTALLFELRMALQIEGGNTGVLIARGVQDLRWTAPPRSTARTAWNVLGSSLVSRDDPARLDLQMWPQAELSLQASSAVFIVGNVPGLGEIPPDYVSDDEATIRVGLADWHSHFEQVRSMSLHAQRG
jgi:hypothetical protein